MPKSADPSLTMTVLNNFMNAARGKSQSDILKDFLRMIIFRGGLSKSGAILVWKKADGMLHLFNEDDFLFKEGYLDRSTWTKDSDEDVRFALHECFAGLAFNTRRTQYDPDVSKNKHYVDTGEPIRDMLCVPIILPARVMPFGVASFHNGPDDPVMTDKKRTTIEVSVNTLCFALESASHSRSKNVFIVHGRDHDALNSLQVLLMKRGVTPVILGEQARTGEVLQRLDDLIAECCAGFVLLTPDDEGRYVEEQQARRRARQNVIFEGGWLNALFRQHKRICFLKVGDLELPSDILGVWYQDFDPHRPDVHAIENVLTEWDISWKPPAAP